MFKFPSYFTGFRSKSDGSAGLTFATQEISAEAFAELKRHHNAFGWLVFGENDISEKDIPQDKAEEDGLSASERERRVMFVYWKHKINDGSFDTWRKQQIERRIDKWKEMLD